MTRKITFLLILIFASCKTTNEIKTNIETSKKFDVIGWYSYDKKEIWALSFPFLVNIETNNPNEELVSHKYVYNNYKKGKFGFLYKLNKDNSLIEENNFSRRKLASGKENNYILYSKHLILDNKISNEIISKYGHKKLNSDSIPLSSFNDFKSKLPFLTKKLLNADSLFIKFKNLDKTKKRQTKRIKAPIEL